MNARPLKNLGTREIVERAERSARDGDRKHFVECITELRKHRKYGDDYADDLEEEFAEPLEERRAPVSISESIASHALSDVRVLTDQDCQQHRIDMIRSAARSIWISTYTLKDEKEELRPLLARKLREKVAVSVIVSPGPIRAGSRAQEVYDDIRRMGVRLTCTTNHSKCVVVDDEHVIVGSANVQGIIFRDLSLRFRSREVARTIVRYLSSMSRE